jgi:phosphate starvation-inducible membrane PsiE
MPPLHVVQESINKKIEILSLTAFLQISLVLVALGAFISGVTRSGWAATHGIHYFLIYLSFIGLIYHERLSNNLTDKRLRILIIILPLFPFFELALVLDHEGRIPFEIPLALILYLTITAIALASALFSMIIDRRLSSFVALIAASYLLFYGIQNVFFRSVSYTGFWWAQIR